MMNDEYQLVIISIPKKYLQSARNSIVTQRSVIENYKGCILGLTDDVNFKKLFNE